MIETKDYKPQISVKTTNKIQTQKHTSFIQPTDPTQSKIRKYSLGFSKSTQGKNANGGSTRDSISKKSTNIKKKLNTDSM